MNVENIRFQWHSHNGTLSMNSIKSPIFFGVDFGHNLKNVLSYNIFGFNVIGIDRVFFDVVR